MIRVNVSKQSNYPVSSSVLKKSLKDFLAKKGLVSDAEVSVALVSEKKMLDLGRKYLKDSKMHNVLAFADEETKGKFAYPPDGLIRLGEIIVCYPQAVKEAEKENNLIENKILELIEHGAEHLLGMHHE